jgi:hypothetical protein
MARKKKSAKDRSVASYINKELGGITPKNPAALAGGPPGIMLDMALTAARGVQEKKLATKEERQANVRKRVNEESRVKKIAKKLAKRTKKRAWVKANTPKTKQFGITKGSK